MCEATIRKVGDEFIAILPEEEVQRAHLRANEKVYVLVLKTE